MKLKKNNQLKKYKEDSSQPGLNYQTLDSSYEIG
jgi:hypothetical protein